MLISQRSRFSLFSIAPRKCGLVLSNPYSHTLFLLPYFPIYAEIPLETVIWVVHRICADWSVKTAIFRDIALFEERIRTTIIAFPPRKQCQWLLGTIIDCLASAFGSIGKRAVTQKLMEKMPILRVSPLECVRVTMHWSIECPQQSTPCYHEYKEARKRLVGSTLVLRIPANPCFKMVVGAAPKAWFLKLYACTVRFYLDKYTT